MVYLFGFLGFVFGFSVGLGIINILLRQRSMKEIQSNKKIHWIYGPMVWVAAITGCLIALRIHDKIYL